MKWLKLVALIAFAGCLIYGSTGLPLRGDQTAPPNQSNSASGSISAGNYFIRSAYKDAKTPNMVTVVLGDYRSLDTLGEQVVVFTAGLVCLLVLGQRRDDEPTD